MLRETIGVVNGFRTHHWLITSQPLFLLRHDDRYFCIINHTKLRTYIEVFFMCLLSMTLHDCYRNYSTHDCRHCLKRSIPNFIYLYQLDALGRAIHGSYLKHGNVLSLFCRWKFTLFSFESYFISLQNTGMCMRRYFRCVLMS